MAFWVGLKGKRWSEIAKRCLAMGLKIPDRKLYDPLHTGHDHIRMGFASLNFEEQTRAVNLLKAAIEGK